MIENLIAEKNALINTRNSYINECNKCMTAINIIERLKIELENCKSNIENCSLELKNILIDGLPFDRDEKLPRTSQAILLYKSNIDDMSNLINKRKDKLEDEICKSESKINSLSAKIEYLSRLFSK